MVEIGESLNKKGITVLCILLFALIVWNVWLNKKQYEVEVQGDTEGILIDAYIFQYPNQDSLFPWIKEERECIIIQLADFSEMSFVDPRYVSVKWEEEISNGDTVIITWGIEKTTNRRVFIRVRKKENT